MSDVQSATESKPEPLSPADFAQLDEGEVRSTPEKPIQAPAPQVDDDEPVAAAEGEEQEAEADPYAEPPEFWSAERKALWEKIADPDARKAIHEQEKERVTATNKKIEETALERKTASEKAALLEQERDQLAAWWKDTGPKLAGAFRSKWDATDWNKLSAENPAEYVRLRQEFDNDSALIRQAAEKHSGEMEAANKRAASALQASKRAEHEKLATKRPEHFGKPDVAQKTYDELRDFLVERGVPNERITNIYEEAVVGIALDAMLYQKAQKAAAAAKANPAPSTTATQTPRRIAPGASSRSQPNGSTAHRQALERLNNGDRLSDEDTRLLFA